MQAPSSSVNPHFVEFLHALGWPQDTSTFDWNEIDSHRSCVYPNDLHQDFRKQRPGLHVK